MTTNQKYLTVIGACLAAVGLIFAMYGAVFIATMAGLLAVACACAAAAIDRSTYDE